MINPSFRTLLLSLLITILSMVIADVQGYRTAFNDWEKRGWDGPKPQFDWKLFGKRMFNAVITGIAAAFGASNTTGGSE